MGPFRVFVAGTDTGVGKTEVSCALLSLLSEAGMRPAAFKPYESGCRSLARPSDACALRESAGFVDPLELICLHRFRAAVAPGVAAARLGQRPSLEKTLRTYRAFQGRSLVVEGAGGLRVPIDVHREVIDLIRLLRLPVLLVARAGLGTLNHTALSLEALARRRIPALAVLLCSAAAGRDSSMKDNAALIRRTHDVKVLRPVNFEPDPVLRRMAFRRALKPLLQR